MTNFLRWMAAALVAGNLRKLGRFDPAPALANEEHRRIFNAFASTIERWAGEMSE